MTDVSSKISSILLRYGLTPEEYNLCRPSIQAENRFVLLGANGLMAVAEAVLALSNVAAANLPSYLGLLATFGVVTLLAATLAKRSFALTQVILHVEVAFVLLFTARMGLRPGLDSVAVSFVVMTAAVPAIWIATPLSVGGLNLVASVAYCAVAFQVKDPALASIDLYNVIIFQTYGTIVHYFLARIRLKGMLERAGLLDDTQRDQDILRNITGGVAIVTVSPAGKASLTYVSSRWLEMFDWTADRVRAYLAGDILRLVVGSYRDHLVSEASRLGDGQHSTFDDLCMEDGTGTIRWVSIDASRTNHPDGTIVYYLVYRDVTAEHRLRAERDAAEHRFQVTLDNSGLFLWDYDLVNDHLICAENTAALLGCAPAIEHASTILHGDPHFPRETRGTLAQTRRRLQAGEENVETDIELIDSEHANRWFHVHHDLELDTRGMPVRVFGIAREITRQKSLERRYEEVRAYFATLAGNAMATFRMDLTENTFTDVTGIPEVSNALLSSCSTADDALAFIARGIASVGEGQEVPLERQALLDAFERGEGQLSFVAHDERLDLWASISISLIRNPFSNHVEAILSALDVTEQTLKDMALEVMLERNYFFMGIVRCTDRRIVLFESASGLVPSTVMDSYDEQIERFLVLGHDSFPSEAEFEHARASLSLDTIRASLDERGSCEFRTRMADHTGRPCTYRFVYDYVDDRHSGVLFSCSDITSTVAEEQHQQDLLAEALESARTASNAKSDFLSHMSHEIRTPLNAIIGMTALAASEVNDTRQVSADLSKIGISARFLLSLVNDVLDMSRIESGRMVLDTRPFDLALLVRDVDTVVAPQATAKGITYHSTMDESLAEHTFMGDRTKLSQVVVNILGNAVKFTPAGGRIELRVEDISGRAASDGTMTTLRLTMSDTGVGMDASFLPHVFEPFSQETSSMTQSFGGSGLGLAISKNIIDMMGGTIDVSSTKGAGTTFVVTVPLADAPRAALANGAPDGNASDGAGQDPTGADALSNQSFDLSGAHVLLVEDNPLNVEVARRLLEKRGAQVTVAENGRAAVEAFESSAEGALSAVLMDVHMPVMDGLEATRAIRSLGRTDATSIPIIAMTADAFEEDVERTREAGMDAHLSKPIEPTLLYEMLGRYIRR